MTEGQQPGEEDPERQKEATEGEQTVPRISGGPELTEAQLREDDRKRATPPATPAKNATPSATPEE